MELSKKIKQIRNENKLTQEQFAEKMLVSRTAVSKWENGTCYPSIDSLKYMSQTFNVSLDSEKSNYIYNVLGTSPLKGDAPIYIESIFENLASGTVTEWATKVSAYTADTHSNYNDFKEPFRAAETPWIVSDAQLSSGTTTSSASVRKLFKFHTISDGDASNFQVKVTIQNIDYKYRTFDVVVRDFNDNDEFPIVLERFSKCNLIEGDSNYIAYKIGTFDGGFISKSKYILFSLYIDLSHFLSDW